MKVSVSNVFGYRVVLFVLTIATLSALIYVHQISLQYKDAMDSQIKMSQMEAISRMNILQTELERANDSLERLLNTENDILKIQNDSVSKNQKK